MKPKHLSILLIAIISAALASIFSTAEAEEENLNIYVDPFIGTGGHGHTYPGAARPFGMVQLSPDTRLSGWDGASGYHYSDSLIYGFSHTHLSGTGVPDYCDILVMPTLGPVRLNSRPIGEKRGYRSRFSHQQEAARPGFYGVVLDDYNIKAELTATERCGFHRYTFPKSLFSNMIIDLTHRDRVIHSGIRFIGDRRIEGFRRSSSWAKDQIIYFSAELSKAPAHKRIVAGGKPVENMELATGEEIKAYLIFHTLKDEKILLKVGLSSVSIQGARRNLEAEIPGWDFEKKVIEAGRTWNKALSRIKVEGGTREQKTIFYTALYHTLLCPNLWSDVDGRYRGMDGRVHRAKGYEHYTVFSLWDTYRALHPLFTIIERGRSADLVRTLLDKYRRGGRLPVWELAANETDCMIGYHSVPVIVDAYLKGIRDFDAGLAFEAIKDSAERDHFGLKSYRRHGYIPSDAEGESVSKTLEYAYDDWCIAMMAQELGEDDDYRRYVRRAQYYKNLYDPATGFMRARVNGGGVEPFHPAEVNMHYTEANSWQYSFYIPQDIHGLVELSGGPAAFEARLDNLFTAGGAEGGLGLPDVTGLIGQYAHGNEPSHHMAYLYDYIGKPHKTQARVREIMDTMYSASPGGLAGNEDCGQMSAWYVLSALGFYPVTPGSDIYALGAPLFEKAVVKLENGGKFVVSAEGNSADTPYANTVTLNGRELDTPFIQHSDIMNGGKLAFAMSSEPSAGGKAYWSAGGYSRIDEEELVPAPWLSPSTRTFKEPFELSLLCVDQKAEIYYTTDGSAPHPDNPDAALYSGPIDIAESIALTARAAKGGRLSFPVTAGFKRIPKGMDIELRTEHNPMYPAGGRYALIDGILGGESFRTGAWQGYHGVDLDAVIDLGAEKEISEISVRFLQDQNSWIFLPTEVRFLVSMDGESFTRAATLTHDIPLRREGAVIEEFTASDLDITARYIRVHAANMGACPPWHKGAGHKAWIFADEIIVD